MDPHFPDLSDPVGSHRSHKDHLRRMAAEKPAVRKLDEANVHMFVEPESLLDLDKKTIHIFGFQARLLRQGLAGAGVAVRAGEISVHNPSHGILVINRVCLFMGTRGGSIWEVDSVARICIVIVVVEIEILIRSFDAWRRHRSAMF